MSSFCGALTTGAESSRTYHRGRRRSVDLLFWLPANADNAFRPACATRRCRVPRRRVNRRRLRELGFYISTYPRCAASLALPAKGAVITGVGPELATACATTRSWGARRRVNRRHLRELVGFDSHGPPRRSGAQAQSWRRLARR